MWQANNKITLNRLDKFIGQVGTAFMANFLLLGINR